jgi:transcriptional regulator with XRE-family HTH domain
MGASRDRIGGSGEMVRSRRLAVGLTQEQLAEMSGLSVRAISDIERGVTSRPRSSSAALLDSVLGLAEPEHRTGPADRGDEAEPVVPRQLPQTIRGFTGRENELGLLNNMLDSTGETTPGTVVISAIGGTAGWARPRSPCAGHTRSPTGSLTGSST